MNPYRFDEELAEWAAVVGDTDLTDPVAARASIRERVEAIEVALPGGVEVRDDVASRKDGTTISPIRVYRRSPAMGTAGVLVYLHGGGFVTGDLDQPHGRLCSLTADTGVTVVSVDYRLAPENPFPAGLFDCLETVEWVVEHAVALQIDPARLGIGGDSAGACLAAGVALLARDRGGPEISFQLLGTPVLDDRLATPSMRQFIDTPIWSRRSADTSWRHYLRNGTTVDGVDLHHYAAPYLAHDLTGLPRAFMSACEFDPLRDEAIRYAARLLEHDVTTELHVYPGTFHGSMMDSKASVSQRMLADQRAAIGQALGG